MKRRLGDICHFYSGTGFPVTYQGKSEGELPFYKVGDIANNAIAGNTYLSVCNNYISYNEAKEIKGTILPKGTIVFAKIGEALKLNRRAITKEECLIDNNAMGIAPNKTILSEKYFYYFMKQLKMQDLAESTTVPSVRKSKLEQVEITLPSLEEQVKIECLLDTVSQIILKRREELEKLDKLIKARFVELFADFIERTKPVDFESICEFVTVGIANSATHAFCDDGVIMFRNQNIKEDYLDTSDIVHITPDFADKYKTKRLKKNDLLIVRTGYPGVACLVPEQFEGSQTFTTLIARIKSDASVNPRFVCHYINSEYGKKYVKDNSAGAAQQNFGATALSKLPICIPTIESQDEYIRFLEQVDKSKVVVQKALDEAQLLFDSLMQKYFG